ncbi:CARDB domain-containing protein [Halosolutus amylolyticus]|uniref:CARDB domain-containing protein n=1 Tax=Halosolutus amylolyticus TaxID=2932267 RepID=A0ABD5PQH1_9EURY|nr:CARDB domain-containing protein [Halosolutus amylolyticus]
MPSSKILFTAAAICFLVAIAVPTAAITIGEDGAADDVALESTSPYATIDDGELTLDFAALNDRSRSEFDDVFSISVADDSIERIWLSHEVDGVTFYRDGDRNDELDESNPIVPAAGDTTSVGVAIDTHVAASGTKSFTVHVEYADEDDENADIELVDVAYSDAELGAGETLTVNATYRNYGDDRGSTIATLVVDGIVVDRQVVHVGAGETETVAFERSMDRSGTFEVGVDDRKPRSITVWPPGEPAPDFAVIEATLEADTIPRGESAAVTATIENTGNVTGETTIELAVGGAVVDTQLVELDPGEVTTVTFERQFDDPGEYAIAVSGVDAGTLTVTERELIVVLNREFTSSSAAAVVPAGVLGFLFAATGVRRRVNL